MTLIDNDVRSRVHGLDVCVDRYDATIKLVYDPLCNRFFDADGSIVHNVLELVTPHSLYLFRKSQKHMFVPHRAYKNVLVEMQRPPVGDCYYCEDEAFCFRGGFNEIEGGHYCRQNDSVIRTTW